jgi:ribulose-5-phosphate 4-epimerase/fuculose-1-phosphate aldolase
MAIQAHPTTSAAVLVARAVRICADAQVMGTQGHCSVRDEADANVMWINNRHSSRTTVRPDEIVPYDIKAGKRVGDGIEPPSEHWIHREIYLRRPDVKGIVHSHPEVILALSAAGHRLEPVITTAAFLPDGGAPVFDSPVLINSEVRSRGMADAMGDASFVVLRQHGAVTHGNSLQQAVVRMVCAEMNAKAMCKGIPTHGKLNFFHGEELRLLDVEISSAHSVKKFWVYLEETAERHGAFVGLS